MPCGDYEAMAKGMGFDCSGYSDEDKAGMKEEIDGLVAAGMSEENAIRYVASRGGVQGPVPEVTMGGAVPTPDPLTPWPDERQNRCRTWGDVSVCFSAGAATEPQEVRIGRFRGVLDPANGQLHVYDVPLFVACKRGEKDFNQEWIWDALADAKAGEAGDYLPPMHVLHHGPEGNVVIPAGLFRMKRIESQVFKDEMRETLLGDLIFTNPEVIGDFLAGRLPYRSIEVMDFSERKIDSLALLDHEPPFLELPMTANVEGAEGWTIEVAPASTGDPVVAFFSRGGRSFVIQENAMVSDYQPVRFQKDEDEEKPPVAEEKGESPPAETPEVPVVEETPSEPGEGAEGDPEAAAASMPEEAMGGEDPAAMGGEDPAAMDPNAPDTSWMEEDAGGVGPIDAEMVTKAILEGTIAVKDFHAIQQAIQQVEAAAHPVGEEEPMAEDPAAAEMDPAASQRKAPPAAAPGEAMKREMDPEKAALMGRVEALETDKAVREEEAAITADVAAAMDSMTDRQLGEDPKGRFEAFRREHGKAAFDAYVGELVRELPPKGFGTRFSASNPAAFDFGKRLPDEVMAFQKDGPEAVARATQIAAQYEELKGRNITSLSLERFLRLSMNGIKETAE